MRFPAQLDIIPSIVSTLELPPPPWIVGHRGAAGEECENTLAAFARGREAGVDMIELDVQLAADGVPVCFHDRDLERLAGRSEVVEDQPSSLLCEIRVGGSHRIPSLGEVLAEVPEQLPLNVELKRYGTPGGDLVEAVLDTLDGRGQILLSSFDWEMLGLVHDLAPGLPLAPLSAPRETRALALDPAGDLIAVGANLGAFALHCSRSMIEPGLVELATSHGLQRVLAYTVNDLEEAERFFAWGVSGIFTDLPTVMARRFHGSRGQSPS